MRILLVIALIFFLSAQLHAQQIPVVKFPAVEKIILAKSDSIAVINFWATWCAPCVKELPYFEDVHATNPQIKVVLVNLDFVEKLDKVIGFVNRKNIRSHVILLDDIDYNSWIDRVDKDWGGAIPATLIVNQKTGQRKFIDHELQSGELQKLIDSIK